MCSGSMALSGLAGFLFACLFPFCPFRFLAAITLRTDLRICRGLNPTVQGRMDTPRFLATSFERTPLAS